MLRDAGYFTAMAGKWHLGQDNGTPPWQRGFERSLSLRQGGLTLRNPNDPESFKVRRAKVGGYRDYFNSEQVAELEALIAARLSPAFGYTVPPDQTEPLAARA